MTEDHGPRIDPHTQAAAEMFNVPVNRVTKDMRRAAKARSFGAAYSLLTMARSQENDK